MVEESWKIILNDIEALTYLDPAAALEKCHKILEEYRSYYHFPKLPDSPAQRSQFLQAIEASWQVMEQEELVEDQLLLAGTLLAGGRACYRLGQYLQALIYLQTSLDLLDRIGPRAEREVNDGRVLAWNFLALLFAETGDYHQAFHYIHRARDAAAQSSHAPLWVRVTNTLGLLLIHCSTDREDGLRHCQESLAKAREVGDRIGESRALNAIGGYYLETGQYAQALPPLERGVALAGELNMGYHLASALSNLAQALEHRGRVEEALEANLRAFSLRQSNSIQLGMLISYFNLGLLLRGHPGLVEPFADRLPACPKRSGSAMSGDRALEYMMYAFEQAGAIGAKKFQVGFAEYLYKVYKQSGDTTAALSFLERYAETQKAYITEHGSHLREFYKTVYELQTLRIENEIFHLRNVELTRAKTRLETLNEDKSALMWTLAHDLKNGLFAVRGWCDLLRQRHPGWEEDSQRLLHRVEDSAQWMSELIGSILNLESIESGQMHIRPVPTPVLPLLRRVINRHASRAEGKSIRWELQVAPPEIAVLADPVALSQILDNLVSNALRYAPPESELTLTAGLEENLVRLEVGDRGPGIAPQDLPRIFKKFTRLQPPPGADRDLEPTFGLGLAIARALVEQMGGSIRCESTLGEGTRFLVELHPAPTAISAESPASAR